MKFAALASVLIPTLAFAADTDWPAAPREAKPWTRWQWTTPPDAAGVTRDLESFQKAGLGGMEIAAKTTNEAWLTAFSQAATDATRLDLGLDVQIFGQPASFTVAGLNQEVAGDSEVKLALPEGKLLALRAYPETGDPVELEARVKKNQLIWKAPEGKWRVLGLIGQSAPPANVDPLSAAATTKQLKQWEGLFEKARPIPVRGYYHGPVSSTGPLWTPDFLQIFQQRHGYDLRKELPAIFGIGEPDIITRVRADSRQVLADLYVHHLEAWTTWAHGKKQVTRFQPNETLGNLIDQAAAVDIPELNVPRPIAASNLTSIQFASSAARLTGRPLVSAKIPADAARVKETADLLWIGGVNHLFFIGQRAPDLSFYITRSQTLLQTGRPATDILLYYPEADFWHAPTPASMEEAAKNFNTSSFQKTATTYQKAGIPCDFISDKLLETASTLEGSILLGDRSYRTLVIPTIRILPEKTAAKLRELAQLGARISLIASLPADVPGFADLEKRRAVLAKSVSGIPLTSVTQHEDPLALARAAGIRPEPMAASGILSTRRVLEDGDIYFVLNDTGFTVDQWLPLNVPFQSAVLFDPRSNDRIGIAPQRNILGSNHIRLALAPGESRFIRTYHSRPAEGREWKE